MINGKCINVHGGGSDRYPRIFVAVPRIGETVRSLDGRHTLHIKVIEYCVVNGQPEIRIKGIEKA